MVPVLSGSPEPHAAASVIPSTLVRTVEMRGERMMVEDDCSERAPGSARRFTRGARIRAWCSRPAAPQWVCEGALIGSSAA